MENLSREKAIEELSLMLLYLTRFQDHNPYSRYQEVSWKGYDYNALNHLEKEDWIVQQRKSKCVYLTENGKEAARALLQKYRLPDQDLYERFEFRTIDPEEAEQAAEMEQICFPPNEACSREMMLERVAKAPELFLVAIDKQTEKVVGLLNGLSTNECTFRDEFFIDASLYDPDGPNIMLLGLSVLPQYRKQGLARELMFQYLRKEHEKGRKMIFLTCLASKVKMYKKMGFRDEGIANSTWGGEQWHEMSYLLNL